MKSRLPVLNILLLAGVMYAPAAALARPLGVEVWTDRGDDAVYQPGDAMVIKVRTSDDAHLLVYEIDTEGRVQVLYPLRRGSGLVEGRSTLRLPPDGSRTELVVERATGQGFLVAIASREPFRALPWYLRPYDPQAESMGYADEPDRNDDEDMTGFDEDGKMVGDPYVGMERVRRRVLGRASDTEDFASSYASYYVHQQVRYPRYVCYDCHSGQRWQWWDGFDPYHTTCSVFDMRVNWSWCWGPCGWNTYVPYYYYVVRSDCPPRYRDWYGRRVRLSSWDDRRRWNDLWGGPLRRIKSDPPRGYIPPGGGRGRNGGDPPTAGPGGPRYKPPGYLDTPAPRRDGTGLPIGRRTRPGGEEPSTPVVRERPERVPGRPAPRVEDDGGSRPPRDAGQGRREDAPRWEPRERPSEPSRPPQAEPRREPSREPARKPDPPPPPKEKPANDDGGKGGNGGGGKGGSGGGGKGGHGGGGKGGHG